MPREINLLTDANNAKEPFPNDKFGCYLYSIITDGFSSILQHQQVNLIWISLG